jgi:hypothetical protein
VRSVAGRDVSVALELLRSLIGSIKDRALSAHDLRQLGPAERVQLMRARKRFVNELEEMLNSIMDDVLLRVSKMSSEEAAQWLQVRANRPSEADRLLTLIAIFPF